MNVEPGYRGSLQRGLLLATFLVAAHAAAGFAQFAIDGGSILLFPHVEANDEWDTIVHIVNTSANPAYAECRYVGEDDNAGRDRLDLELAGGQATHWLASRGRSLDPDDAVCLHPNFGDITRCDGAGIDPGVIPALDSGFRGYLICVQVDRSRAPESGNALAGTATLRRSGSADVAKYAAFPIVGNEENDADQSLCLGGGINATCTRGAEYAACPETWFLTLPFAGGSGGVTQEGTDAHPAITVLPCGVDLASPASEHTLQIVAFNEFQQSFSTSILVVGWRHTPLADISVLLTADVLGSEIGTLRIRPSRDSGPVVVLGQLVRSSDSNDRLATSFVAAHPLGESQSTISLATATGATGVSR